MQIEKIFTLGIKWDMERTPKAKNKKILLKSVET